MPTWCSWRILTVNRTYLTLFMCICVLDDCKQNEQGIVACFEQERGSGCHAYCIWYGCDGAATVRWTPKSLPALRDRLAVSSPSQRPQGCATTLMLPGTKRREKRCQVASGTGFGSAFEYRLWIKKFGCGSPATRTHALATQFRRRGRSSLQTGRWRLCARIRGYIRTGGEVRVWCLS